MSENNKSYRIRTKIGVTNNSPVQDKYLTVKLTDKIDNIEIMSLKIKQENAYKFHCADYGAVVGRAIANGGFGVPNVKVSVFIAATDATKNDAIYNAIYPYERVTQKNKDNIRYNLLPDVGDDDCYQVVGTFPNKRLVLDDDNYLEIYDKYYKFTTRTNNAGDYMIFGIPTGGQILHFDTDLSDVGVLSQKPRDMIYKGYNINQFENPNQFKTDDNLANLPQIISQDDSVYVYPFWGDEDENVIGITRHDIDINYKFEPTCVFIGSIVSDTNSNHISKKCVPTEQMGMMEELITGSGTIEMIRKKQNGDVEQFNIQGTQLINNDGIWCYQIPMNLDYCMTDEYGNLVPSNDPTKGIATRTKVRFRFSMQDFENDSLNSFRTKVLVPNNPQNSRYEPDYVFGSFTEEESFRDLLWNNVYTVKSFIPRLQKGNSNRNRRFSGIKQCNYNGQNNPIPYNNMRINLSFQFVITCLIVRLLIWIVGIYNAFMTALANVFAKIANNKMITWCSNAVESIDKWRKGGNRLGKVIRSAIGVIIYPLTLPLRLFKSLGDFFSRMCQSLSCIYIDGSMCDTLEDAWYFAPNCSSKGTVTSTPNNFVWRNAMAKIEGKKSGQLNYTTSKSKSGGGMDDSQSIDNTNKDDLSDPDNQTNINGETTTQYVLSRGINYFLQCIEISLAQEFRVIQFDFYNDWINGMIYIPRWQRSLRKKRKYFLFGKSSVEVRACNDVYKKRFFERKNNLTEQCAVSYKAKVTDNSIGTKVGCKSNKKYKCHKKHGRRQINIFGDGGAVHQEQTASGLYAYYFKPCEYLTYKNSIKNRKVNLFATDIVLLGSLVDCDINGTPVFTNELTSTTYQIPSPLAHTDSTEEGVSYVANENDSNNIYGSKYGFNGVFDVNESILNPKDDGSVTEESGIDWGYTGPGQGEVKKAKTYTPGGHFLGISCTNAESSIKSCVNLKRICELGVWPSQRQEVFNGYDGDKNGKYLDIIPNGLIAKDDISGGNFRKIFATMNHNNLKTKVNDSGFTVYDFSYMTPENFGGELSKYSKGNYNDANPIVNMEGYLAKNGDVNDYGEQYTNDSEATEVSLTPIRRSLDERDSDYMKFRLGLENDANGNIQTKYLGNDDYGYYMPVYNNSYYFYFGLVPGSTALDEFHKQFFAECKHTMSTEDMRLIATMSYQNHCCNNQQCKDTAFDYPIEISIFDTGITFNTDGDRLRIFSTALPIKIVVDSKYTHVIKDEITTSQVYVESTGWTEDGRNVFDFEIGKHTITITDSEGRSVTKLVEVVQQKITICPTIEGIPFNKDNYILNSTSVLASGGGINRESLEGWFSFNWENSGCNDFEIFKYTELLSPECNSNETKTAKIGNGVCLLFVSGSHIIKFGKWDKKITSYSEFSDYDEIYDVFSGGSGNTGGFHFYAAEEGNYDIYVLYSKDGKETQPILIADNIYIGEPDAIDFDVFRTVIESEDDSPVTYRNPIVKLWYKYPNDWWTRMYVKDGSDDELSNISKWYIRKTIFYVLSGTTEQGSDFNENFPSERTLYVNLYYPSTVGNVICKVDGAVGQTIKKTHGGATSGIKKITEHRIQITGVSSESGNVYAPLREYGGGVFKFPVYYKPYYYQSVIWEGYTTVNNKLSWGHVNGDIYNGVIFDSNDGPIFGPTVLNDTYNINVTPGSVANDNDFDNTRKSKISFETDHSVTLQDISNSLLITEGSPSNFKSEYPPVEYSIEVNSIGNASNYVVDFEMVLTGSTKSAKFKVTFDNNDYEQINWYFGLNKPLTNTEVQNTAITSLTSLDIVRSGYSRYGEIYPNEDDSTINFDINLPTPENNGIILAANKMKSGSLMMESIKHDMLKYSSVESSLGFLSSRNFIRNGFDFDYSYDVAKKNAAVFIFMTLSDKHLKRNKKSWDRGIIGKNVGDAVEDDYGIRKLYIRIPYIDTNLDTQIGNGNPIVILKIDDTHEYDLVNDLGYGFEYKYNAKNGGYLVVELSEPYPENSIAWDEDSGKYIDDFTTYITNKFFNYERRTGKIKYHDKRYKNTINCTLTIVSSDIGDGKEDEFDSIGEFSFTFDTKIIFKSQDIFDEDDE